MKKILSITLAAAATFALVLSCSKAEEVIDDPVNYQEEVTPSSGEVITISAVLSDALTKVTFTPGADGSSHPILTLTWEASDKLVVADHADSSNYEEFDLISGDGAKSAVFSGTLPTGAASYDVSVKHGAVAYNTIEQEADDDPSHLEYVAAKKDITDLDTIVFDEICGVLCITAKLPANVVETVRSVYIEASENIFNTGNTLNITLNTAVDDGDDDILKLYAPLPVTSKGITAGTTLLVRFNGRYTRLVELTAATLTPGKLNEIKINCVHTDQYAGKDDDGTAAHPYLIGDKYQMDAIRDLLVGDQTLRYFKMIDDINMSDITWIPLNNVADGESHYSKYISFDGDGHTLSYITTKASPTATENYPSVFGILNGSVTNLTIDHATIHPGSYKAGVLAGYIGSSDCTVTPSVSNITITNSTVGTDASKGSSSCGILCAQIDKASTSVSNITITDCGVVSTSTASTQGIGGMVGYIRRQMTISGTNTVSGTTVKGGSYVGGLVGNINTATATYTTTISGTNKVSSSDVSGTSVIGGVVGFANTKTDMSGCTFTEGTVSATARYLGGMLGSTGDQESIFADCHVEDATISNTVTADARTGGFVGQLQTKCIVKGCTVGTDSQRVTVELATPASASSKLNAGGFAGVSYGSIRNNGVEVRSKAYVTVTCSNPSAADNAAYELNLGGFTGYHSGSIDDSDADVVMSDICGKNVGGFCGLLTGGTIEDSSVTGSVSGNNAVGGFVGYVNNTAGTISNCSSSAVVTRTGSWGQDYGSFGGLVDNVTITKCYATSTIEVNANYVGGFIGRVAPSASATATIQKCWSTGNMVSNAAQCGGFIGQIAGNASGTVNVYDCYETGNITSSNQRNGAFIGQISSGIVTVARCYASGTISGTFAQGGLVGFMNATATIEDCAAWNASVTAVNIGEANWSSGAVIGVAWPVATLTNNYRKPEMNITAYWGNVTGYTKLLAADYDHPDVSSSNPLVVVDISDGATLRATTATSAAKGQDNFPHFAYQGKHVAGGTSLSTLASTAKGSGGLGWDGEEVWDFSDDLPTLR